MDGIKSETTLIVEAILREIIAAQRWQTIRIAWSALLRVRSFSNALQEEADKITPSCGQEPTNE